VSGFFGIVRQGGKPVEDQFLKGIAEQLSFRGPDGTDVWAKGTLAVASHGYGLARQDNHHRNPLF
jgi:asparagine synthetase B (glutamine-hydrolysing)